MCASLARGTVLHPGENMKNIALGQEEVYSFRPSLVFCLWYTEHKETNISSDPSASHRSLAPLNHRPTTTALLQGTRHHPERIFAMKTRNMDDFIRRDLERDMAYHERSLKKQQQAHKPPAPQPSAHFLSHLPSKPLTWLWPGRIPYGHLTLLDGAPGSGLSLVALTLAACVSSGSPLPDGTPTQQGLVLLLAPYDSPSDTLKRRLEAAGGDPAHVMLVHPLLEDASHALARTRSYAFPHDLDDLASLIRNLKARLLIIDPASAIPGLSRCLPALVELAHQTNCAILLTRSLRQSPADPLHSSGPTSPVLQAARSRLLLAPDPTGDGRQLLLTTKHPLCTQPGILAYDILASEAGIPTIHWLGQRDRFQLTRLCTGPIRSPYRQAILRFLQNSAVPRTIPDILEATSYGREAGRKMLLRMKMAGELVSPARGLYTTAKHPCLLHFTNDPPPVPNVPNVPNVPSVPSPQSPPLTRSPQSEVPLAAAVLFTDSPPCTYPSVPNVPNVPNVPSVSSIPSSQLLPLVNSPQSDVSPVPNVSSVSS